MFFYRFAPASYHPNTPPAPTQIKRKEKEKEKENPNTTIPLPQPPTKQNTPLTKPPSPPSAIQIFGKSDPHVPAAARSLIRTTLHDAGVRFSFYEILHAQHAFIRDESSKGRYDPAVTGVCFSMLLECFGRCLRGDLGERDGEVGGVGENVC